MGAPRFLAIDGGEEVPTWLPGHPVTDWRLRGQELDELARIVRQLDDLTTDLTTVYDCLVHDDLPRGS